MEEGLVLSSETAQMEEAPVHRHVGHRSRSLCGAQEVFAREGEAAKRQEPLGADSLHFREGALERVQVGADGAAQVVDAKRFSEVRLEVAFDGPDDPQPLRSARPLRIGDARTRERLRERREQLLLRPFDFDAGHGLGRVAVGPDDLPDVGDDMPQAPSLCVGDRDDPRLAGQFDAESLEQRATDLERDPLRSGRQAEVELVAFGKQDHVGRAARARR